MAKDIVYAEFAQNHIWVGPTKNKGLGVFAKPGIQLEAVRMDLEPLELFLPVLVDGQWTLLATWTKICELTKLWLCRAIVEVAATG